MFFNSLKVGDLNFELNSSRDWGSVIIYCLLLVHVF